jgi:hypothetical protein
VIARAPAGRAGVSAALVALALAGLVAAAVTACVKPASRAVSSEVRIQKLNEITTLWAQIRAWRREEGMELEPPTAAVIQWRGRSVPEAAGVCPSSHPVPATCGDVCNLADAICDNAERICTLADELGPDDHLAQDKCASAKASCREAKQRCCACSAAPVPAPAADGAAAPSEAAGARRPGGAR